mmetsp:Transcript_29811/g.5382  ORF Transcript_29811/g.5382 Transcript_29811/m.5382 type:complete len:85 (+) Transcript_29811:682-936(+)
MCKFRLENLPFTLICDLLAVACALDTSIISDYEDRYTVIELNGGITRGQLVVYRCDTLATPQANVRIVNDVDLDKIKEKMQLII